MIKKLLIVPTLIMLVLSGCSGQGAAETTTTPAVTDTQPATAEVAISTTEAPVSAETMNASPEGTAATETAGTPGAATPTLGTPRPTNPPGCTNSAMFVADVTVPDNTIIGAGTDFTKTWRIVNTGTCVWGPDYALVHYSQERMGAPDTVPLPVTFSNQNADITVQLTAPSTTGKHQAHFVIQGPGGVIMKIGDDSRLWVIIEVTPGGAPAATLTPTSATSAATATTSGSTLLTATVAPPTTATQATSVISGNATSTVTTADCLFSTDRTKLAETIQALNDYRAGRGLPPYTLNVKLAQAAQRHASDMACNNLFVHTGSDRSTPQTRVRDTGYTAASVSENVYGSYPPLSGEDVIAWWINDLTEPRHGQNLVSTTFTEIGVGYSFFDNYGYYVIVFAKP